MEEIGEAMTKDSQNPQDVSAQLEKIQQHLTFLEKKIDTLISQSAQSSGGGGGTSFPRRHFSKPRRDFDHGHSSHGHPKAFGYGGGGHRPSQREGSHQGPPRQAQGFFHKKKRFASRHEKA